MKDGFGRTIDYLRISLTDKCNLRCRYCMPPEGINHIPHEEILSYEEIEMLAGLMAGMGLKKIRLTGGEPLIRRDLVSLIEKLHKIEGIEEICLTTNGLLFSDLADPLKAAGLSRVNISLDTLNEDLFYKITGFSGLEKVLKSIDTALALNFPLKINVVPSEWNKSELCDLALLAKNQPLDVRFIELMPLGAAFEMKGLTSDFVRGQLEARFGRAIQLPGNPHSPARLFQFDGFKGKIAFISPLSHAFCTECNRVRLTANGMLKLCLCYDDALNVKEILRSGKSADKIKEELKAEIQKALLRKPQAHQLNEHIKTQSKMMTQIGG